MSEREKGNLEKVAQDVGSMAGRAADTAVDWMGTLLRGAAGSLGGWWSDRGPAEALQDFGESEDRACRSHFENSRKQRDASYDAVRPLYQFGHLAGSNPDYQGRSFEEVEGELQGAWSTDQARQHGDWGSVRDYVGTGYRTTR